MESFFNANTLFAVTGAVGLAVAGMVVLILLHFLHFMRNVDSLSKTVRMEFDHLAGDLEDIRGDIQSGRRYLKSFIRAPRSITPPKGVIGSHHHYK